MLGDRKNNKRPQSLLSFLRSLLTSQLFDMGLNIVNLQLFTWSLNLDTFFFKILIIYRGVNIDGNLMSWHGIGNLSVIYEGWNFNSGNYLLKTDTK